MFVNTNDWSLKRQHFEDFSTKLCYSVSTMSKNYVEERDGGYWVKGTRISLDSIVTTFKRGTSPRNY